MDLKINIGKGFFSFLVWLLPIFQRWVLVRDMSLAILASPLQGLPTTGVLNDYK